MFSPEEKHGKCERFKAAGMPRVASKVYGASLPNISQTLDGKQLIAELHRKAGRANRHCLTDSITGKRLFVV
jgi:hypothetical protein